MVKPLCKHCRKYFKNRPRGLCFSCYENMTIRLLYPVDHRYMPQHPLAKEYYGFSNDQRKLPPHPTTALPGTPDKIAVMTERLLQGYQLHHPLDPRLPSNFLEVLAYVG